MQSSIAPGVLQALDWVSCHLDRFSPFDDRDIYRPSRTKAFVELAIMSAVYVALTGDSASPAIRGAARLLQTACDRADFADWSLRYPADIVNYAELCAAVDRLGGDSGALRHRVQSAVDMGLLSHVERIPHRVLELRVALDWAGVTHSLPPIDDICAQTMLASTLSAPLLSDVAIYSITHVILFGSRFGLMQDTMPKWFRSAPVRTLLCDLLVIAGQTKHWDLLGELLLCWDCVGFEHDLVTKAGWVSFLRAFRADGAVLPWAADRSARSPTTQAKQADQRPDFNHVYHTTLVAIIAGVVQLNRSQS